MNDAFGNLQKFIANNYELEKLEANLNEFNPLKILKVDQYEIRHSNILSWLLTPNENHNIGSSFLKKFLAEVIIHNENLETKRTVFEIQDMSYQDVIVKREWNDIDIFIAIPSKKFAIIIENKIYAKESKGQLKKYYDLVTKEYGTYDVIPVFLTLEGVTPSDVRYGTISYSQILHMLDFIASIQKENLNEKVYDFINYYLRVLEILTMENKDIKQLCKRIYKDHKEALDLISEYAKETDFEESAKEFIKGINAKELYVDGKTARFIPQEFENNIEKVGQQNWCKGYPFTFWFMAQDEKLGLIIEVGPFDSAPLRQQFLEHLKKHGFTIHDYSFKPEARYTRIFTKYPKFEDWDNKHQIIQKMDNLYTSSSKKAEANLLEACKTFNWGSE